MGEPTLRDVAELPAGAELGGRFRIRREIGRGGMGVVYEADQLALEREVALKTLHPDLLQDPLALERFKREARVAATIEHDGIVRVFDLATEDGVTFIVMERLRGEDLRQRIKRAGALAWQDVVKLGIELADAIAAAHERGILHRDLSPGNVFLAHDDAGQERVKVLDFGIARLLSAAGLHSQPSLGTLMYMAPERVIEAADTDPRSDIYAIGAVLYEALAGAPPYPVCEYPELALKIALQEPLPLRARCPACPEPVVAVVQRAMQRQRKERWQSAQELGAALASIPALHAEPPAPDVLRTAASAPRRSPSKPRARSKLIWLGVATLVGAAGLAAFARPSAQPKPAANASAQRPQRTRVAVSAPALVARAPSPQGAEPQPSASASATEVAATQLVNVVTHPPGAQVTASGAGPCRAPCSLRLAPRSDIVVRAQNGAQHAQQRLALPLPAQVELWLRPVRSAANTTSHTSTNPSSVALPPLMPRR